jgi:hypothetical protein
MLSSSKFDAGGTVCSVGFEPNPRHTAALKDLEKSYNECGWRVKFFTKTAVSNA